VTGIVRLWTFGLRDSELCVVALKLDCAFCLRDEGRESP